MHYYQFNIGDYKSHTEHLSEMEDLAYRRLLDWYYLHESPIPLDIEEVARQIRMRSHTESIAVVLREFFEHTKKGWVSHRANIEIAKAGEKSTKAKASAKARWNKEKDANALPAQSESNATQDTRHITQDTKKRRSPKVEQTLDQYLADCKTAGVKPIPDEHAVRKYAEDAGIDNEMLQVNWLIFRDRHVGQPKTYKDWPGAFSNSVKSRWYGLWYIDGDEVKWTSTGLQEKKVIETRMKEANHG